MKEHRHKKWALRWGDPQGLIGDGTMARLFQTRADARDYAQFHFGYIKTRKDLRGPPHFWRMPVPVRVVVTVREAR